jgi:hypothetical protein
MGGAVDSTAADSCLVCPKQSVEGMNPIKINNIRNDENFSEAHILFAKAIRVNGNVLQAVFIIELSEILENLNPTDNHELVSFSKL